MIIVTGATGQLGRAIVESLARRIPASQIVATARAPEKATGLGVQIRQADFAQPESLAAAFEGATQVLLVSSNAAAYGGDPLAQHRAAIDAARAAGARRILYTSHMAASETSAFPPMRDHAATEKMLAASGVAWTSLRNGFYASSALAFLGDALETGVVAAPEDGKVAWTAHADLAEAASAILAKDGSFDGATPPLTGAEALDLAQVAALSGRPVRRELVSEDALRQMLAARGAPAAVAGILLGFYHASRAGEFAAVDPTLERLIGRAPIGMREVVTQKR